jgi:DMSO/TMAO reductase YedYZ molybdopterin-dependent catalytic subunit
MNEKDLRKRTIKSFIIFLLGGIFILSLWNWIRPTPDDEVISPELRTVLEFNGRIWHSLFSPQKTVEKFKAPPVGKKPRINGDIGLRTPLSLADWKLNVVSNADDPHSTHFQLNMEEIRSLPRVQSTAEFKCIEGWSEVISYTGVRFSDFLKHYRLGSRSPDAWKDGRLPENRYLYVAMETPDREYYVSLDMESMLHPQTILAYEMNGQPISEANGAPLRLIVPVKYGIKSLKRIGKIYFSDQRPPDYWAEQGYDWFSGL